MWRRDSNAVGLHVALIAVRRHRRSLRLSPPRLALLPDTASRRPLANYACDTASRRPLLTVHATPPLVVAVGMELVAMPSFLFMDEPTSGLDGAATVSLARCMGALRKSGLTIICVIHQVGLQASSSPLALALRSPCAPRSPCLGLPRRPLFCEPCLAAGSA